MNEGPTIEAGYLEELRSALEKCRGPVQEYFAYEKCTRRLFENADQLLSDAKLGQLIREGGVIEAALKPFAEAAECLDNPDPDRMEIWEHSAAMCITAGDLRRAVAALLALQELSDER